jgi:nitrile hydratase accessory protein
MYHRRRNLVRRPDGRLVNVARPRGQLFVCASGCCCGRTEDGFAAVPSQRYHDEWERRRLRNIVHLTVGGCLGPCALANVVLLLFDGQAQWFHSINSDALVVMLYDHIEEMLEADRCLSPSPALAPYHFTATAWQPRPDGQPVDDRRPRQRAATAPRAPAAPPATVPVAIPSPAPTATASPAPALTSSPAAVASTSLAPAAGPSLTATPTPCSAPIAAPWPEPPPTPSPVRAATCSSTTTIIADERGDAHRQRLLADLAGPAAAPRRNGELVFDAPWQGRVLGMTVALSEQGAFAWEEFRQELIRQIGEAETRGGEFRYYDAWLAAFERVLARGGLVTAADLDEVTYQFEYGERDDVF